MSESGSPAGPPAAELVKQIDRARRHAADHQAPGFYEQVIAWLDHNDAGVREEALRYLAQHCRQRDDARVLLTMVEADASADVRKAAAECLGGVFRSTRDREVNAVLASVARNGQEQDDVRAAAFAAIKRINGYRT